MRVRARVRRGAQAGFAAQVTVDESLETVEADLRSGWSTLTTSTGPVLANAANIAFVQEASKPAVPLARAAAY